MGRITDFSQIETFRLLRHGEDSRLRFLTDDTNDAAGYTELVTLVSHFYITKGGLDANTGEFRARLAFNKPDAVASSLLERIVFIDLILENGTRVLRYRRSSENPPTTTENRWYVVITGAFNDKTPFKPLDD